jgi:hypothetical protein
LLGIEFPRASVWGEGESRCEPFELQASERWPKGHPNWSRAREGAGEEAPVHLVQLERYLWLRPTLEVEDSGVDARWRRERLPVEMPADRDLVPGPPIGRAKRRRPDSRVLRGELPLHDHVRSLQRQAWITKQPSEDRPRAGNGRLATTTKGSLGQSYSAASA